MAEPEGQRQHRFRPPPSSCSLLLVRHGESAAAVAGRPFDLVGGHGDPPLHEAGRQQAEAVADRLASEPLSALYVTTLRRTVETAAPLAARLGLEPQVEPDLREVYLGEWEGGEYRLRAAEGHPTALAVLEQERWDLIPGAEPAAAFDGRVRTALTRLAERHPGELVALFTHGGVIGSALSQAAHARPFAFIGADNASISNLVIADGRWIVRAFNDTAHLGPAWAPVGTTASPAEAR
ncbi:MAG TPA: histidine phosphatase family protein [Acidimicrobiales bacterium]|nr:histidine phosphatase family protein [Acidimicrobiales bacterium]